MCDDVITLDAGALAAANGFAKVKLSDLSTFSPQTDKGVMLCELRLQFTGTEFRVKGVTRWLWTGAAAEGAQSGINAFSGGGLGQVRIRRIVGYARTEDAEIADARLGADGVRYSTLGEALRRQIGALERRVAALEGGEAS